MECNTMTVLEAYQRLGKLINQSKGDLHLIALEGEGKTCNISIDNFVSKVTEEHTGDYVRGVLSNLNNECIGTEYIGIKLF